MESNLNNLVEIPNKKISKKENLQKIIKLFWIFLIGSIIGYIIEMIVGLVQNRHFVSSQGHLFGSFIQVYGVGIVIYYLVISNIKQKNYIKIFFISMLLGGIVEYLFSFFQEVLFRDNFMGLQ